MPTAPGSDLLPVRRATKARLAAVKGDATYDEVLRALLEATPPEVLRARLDLKRAEAVNVARALAGPRRPQRTPEKQLLLADLAAKRRLRWKQTGRLVVLGPRRERYIPPPLGVRAEVRRVR